MDQKSTKITKTVRRKTTSVSKARAFTVAGFTHDGLKKSVNFPQTLVTSISAPLVAQLVRVHQERRRQGTQSTKTRGEVVGSTRKIYRQKGTGRARHGDIKAPIFVGGGIVFGPHPREFAARLPQKMRRKALLGLLTDKVKTGNFSIITDADKFSGKTKEVALFLSKTGLQDKSVLMVTGEKVDNLIRGARNLEKVAVRPMKNLSAVELLQHDHVVFTQDALDQLTKNGRKTQL